MSEPSNFFRGQRPIENQPGTAEPAETFKATARLKKLQFLTLTLMILGYSGYYLCRSDLSVALPMIVDEMVTRGIPASIATVRLGSIASLGVLAYAIGKFPSGSLADFLGGRRSFFSGMGGSILCTAFFALAGGIPIFTLAWILNRLVQSMGWAGLVKITSKWFSYSNYGTAMALVSLSYLFGDAASREFMAILIGQDLGWRGVFFVAAGVLLAILLLNFFLLKETPKAFGEREPPANPRNVFGHEGERHAPTGFRELLAPLMRNRAFWTVCLISLGFTIVRETFNLWTPTYFKAVVGLSASDAAHRSALFPLFGGFSVVLCGFLSDKLGRAARAAILFGGLVSCAGVLVLLGRGNFSASVVPVLYVSLIAVLLLGPYSYLAGAISLDFGGKQGSATASGFIDGIGYLGGVLAGDSVARITVAFGWGTAFFLMAGVCLLLSVAAAVFWAVQSERIAA